MLVEVKIYLALEMGHSACYEIIIPFNDEETSHS